MDKTNANSMRKSLRDNDPNYGGNQLLAAYIDEQTSLKVSPNAAYDFGKGDFSATLLLSADTEGIILGYVKQESAKAYPKGWYLELLKDCSIYFYTGDGDSFAAVTSEPVPELEDGYLYFLTASRKGGTLSIILETELLTVTREGSTDTALDVSCGSELYFGGLENNYEEEFCGVIKDVTLWSKAIGDAEYEYVYNDILPFDMTDLRGWWSLGGTLKDLSPVSNAISHAKNLRFVEIFDILQAEIEGGYQYENINQTGMPLLLKNISADVPLLMERKDKIKRKIKVTIEKKGVFLGTCNEKSPLIAFPDGVELTVLTPSGQSIAELSDTQEQIIRRHGTSIQQFLFLNPEQGDWTIEISASPDSSFDFDYQYIPENTEREDIVQSMYTLYGQYAHSEKADGITPEYFIFSSLGRIMMMDLEAMTQKESKQKDCIALGDPVVIIGIGMLIAAAATVIGAGYGVCKFIGWVYNQVTESSEYLPAFSWETYTTEISQIYTGSNTASRVYADIAARLNHQTPSNPKDFYKKSYLDSLSPYNYLHLDLGGEGCFECNGINAGFAVAININTQTNNSQYKNIEIPWLIQMKDWDSQLPFENHMVDRITAQSIEPFTDMEIDEIARCIRKDPKGKIDIWTFKDSYPKFRLNDVISLMKDKYGLSKKYDAYVDEEANDEEFDYSSLKGYYKYSIIIYKKS